MSNRVMTQDEVMVEIVKPMHAAFLADKEEAKAEARAAFAKGEKTYPTTVFGLEVVYTPENING